MAQMAQIIVDVPTMQTNQPYTYRIPDELTDQIKPGMRVVVPFGRGSRKVQGFVVGLDEQVDFDGTLKSIDSLLELHPVLNEELLQLAQWLAKKTFAFQITCMFTMLPNVMRSKTKRFFYI